MGDKAVAWCVENQLGDMDEFWNELENEEAFDDFCKEVGMAKGSKGVRGKALRKRHEAFMDQQTTDSKAMSELAKDPRFRQLETGWSQIVAKGRVIHLSTELSDKLSNASVVNDQY